MRLDQRITRLETASLPPVTAEMLLAEMETMTVYDDDRVAALSRRMPEAELETAIAEIKRMIEDCEA